MRIRTCLILSYLVILALLGAGVWFMAERSMASFSEKGIHTAERAVQEVSEANFQLSRKMLTAYGERLVEAKAEEVAQDLAAALVGRDMLNYDELRNDSNLRRIATQNVETWDGVAGYMALTDKTGISILHPNKNVEGTDFFRWKDQYPDLWKLVETSFTERRVKGYYDFIDTENKKRSKYLVRIHVPNTPFVAVAIVNIDQFFTPVHERIRNAGELAVHRAGKSISDSMDMALHDAKALSLLGGLLLLALGGLFGMLFARLLSNPIMKLRDGVRIMGTGNLRVKVPARGVKEVRDLASAFNELGRQLDEYIAKRDFIRDTFGRYLTAEIVDKLLESSDALRLGGEAREITIMMSDLRGFTSLSASWGPETVIEILNRYLSRMVDIILDHEGAIDDIIGDGILTLFGAPRQMEDHPARAVACALAMQCAMEEVNALNEADGYPHLEMGIAINTGNVVVGNIGSERRRKYSAIGSDVNVTGRAESFAVGGQVLITRATYERITDIVEVSSTLKVEMKGVPEPVELFEVSGIRGKYQVSLQCKEEVLADLEPPVRVTVQRLTQKIVAAEEWEGLIVRIARKSAVVQCPCAIAQWENVKLTMPGDAGDHADGRGPCARGPVVDGDGTAPTPRLADHHDTPAARSADEAIVADQRARVETPPTRSGAGEIYGKVLSVTAPTDASSEITVRFTSLSPDAQRWIRGLCG
ncbi:MAG: adenylate/guanylate cyclase domain-containing protein [Thermodesulfobacteriota bacterium]